MDDLCPSCGTGLSPSGSFCPACGSQARCKQCSGLLESEARACVLCGAFVRGEATRVDEGVATAASLSTLELMETEKRRLLKISVTDTAIAALGDPIGQLLEQTISRPLRNRQGTVHPATVIDQEQLALPLATEQTDSNDAAPVNATSKPRSAETGTDSERMRKIFQYDGDRLQLIEPRLKAANKLDAARRLTYLFVYAHELEGRDRVSREALNVVLKDAILYDSNTLKWIREAPDLATEDGSLGLRVPGREQARHVLNAVVDPEVPDTWVLGTKSARGTNAIAPRDGEPAGSVKGSTRRDPGTSKKAASWLAGWKSLAPSINAQNAHALLKDRSVADQAIFGLWAIRKVARDDDKEVSSNNLAQFLLGAFELKVDDRHIDRALKQQATKDKRVINTHGVTFQITQSGSQYAERMAAEAGMVAPTGASDSDGLSAT